MKKLLRCTAATVLVVLASWSTTAQAWDYPICEDLLAAESCEDGRLVCTWRNGPSGGGACVCTGVWECW
jgi:hypothetical protein